MELARRLSRLGVHLHKDPAVGRRVSLTNSMAMTLGSVVLLYFPILIRSSTPVLGWAVLLIFGAYMGVLQLNKWGRFTLARLAFITFLNSAIFFYSGYLGSGAGGHLYLLATACLPIILASMREKAFLAYGVSVPIVFFEILTLARDRVFPQAIISPHVQSWIYRGVVGPTTFLILLAELTYFSLANERAEERLERNREFRLLLDNAGQGFLTVDRSGRVGEEWSRIIETWMGGMRAGAEFAEVLRPIDASAAEWFELGWGALFADLLPLELAIDQLPKVLRVGDRHLGIEYRPFLSSDSASVPDRVLIVLSDITSEVERRRVEQAQQEVLQVVDHVMRDRVGFREFYQETSRLLLQLEGCHEPAELRHILHTLKGSCALFGVNSVSQRCHQLESRLAETGAEPTPAEVRYVRAAWDELCERVKPIISAADDRIELMPEEYSYFIEALSRRVSHGALLARAVTWRFEPAEMRFLRISEQARALARRLGKGEIEVAINGGGVRLEPERWAGFFSAFSHVVRNAIDHGLESPDERQALGKSPRGRLELRARKRSGEIILSMADDGRGVQWDRVAERARALGLPADTQADLEDALFADGVSTRTEVSEVSGRGLGMAAVKAACQALGGRIAIWSARGQGTCFEFHVPLPETGGLGAGNPTRPPGAPTDRSVEPVARTD